MAQAPFLARAKPDGYLARAKKGEREPLPPQGGEGTALLKARDQTWIMLEWFRATSIESVDVAVRRPKGAMVWHRSLGVDDLPLGFLGAENVRRGEVYIRPARGRAWPLVFLDDVDRFLACAVARKYRALVVETSQVGGCHIWLACDHALDERDRAHAQRWLAGIVRADPASTSGEHLGRLAGCKNWKRGGVWVNVLARSTEKPPWNPAPALKVATSRPIPLAAPEITRPICASRDDSSSGREWAWVCRQLEHGCDPHVVCQRLVERARDRRGLDADRYANRTIARALRHVP